MKGCISFSRQLVGFMVLTSIASLFFLCTASQSMPMNAMAQSSPCGMSHSTDFCPMAFSGRLSFWQSLIVPVAPTFDALALLMFLVALAFFGSGAAVLALTQSQCKRIYENGFSPPFNYLLAQFSKGILRPKIY